MTFFFTPAAADDAHRLSRKQFPPTCSRRRGKPFAMLVGRTHAADGHNGLHARHAISRCRCRARALRRAGFPLIARFIHMRVEPEAEVTGRLAAGAGRQTGAAEARVTIERAMRRHDVFDAITRKGRRLLAEAVHRAGRASGGAASRRGYFFSPKRSAMKPPTMMAAQARRKSVGRGFRWRAARRGRWRRIALVAFHVRRPAAMPCRRRQVMSHSPARLHFAAMGAR